LPIPHKKIKVKKEMPPLWGYLSILFYRVTKITALWALITMSTIIHKPHRGDILIEKSEIPKVIQATLGRNINRKDVK
jgi:hypothetical protein